MFVTVFCPACDWYSGSDLLNMPGLSLEFVVCLGKAILLEQNRENKTTPRIIQNWDVRQVIPKV